MGDDRAAEDRLDQGFLALADPVRRAIIARLSTGPATVNELAEPHPITTQAVSRHIAAATPSVARCTSRRPGSRS